MKEIFSDRKNKGNVTYRITLSDDSGRVYCFVQKLIKKRSQEKDKKVTKKIVSEYRFFAEEIDDFRMICEDEIMYEFCLESLKKVENDR